MKSLTFFNNRAGVGKTTMTFNLAHMFARMNRTVAVLDCDPQCNLSALALSEDQLAEAVEAKPGEGRTVAACLEPVRLGGVEVHAPRLLEIGENVSILPGDLSLSLFEDMLVRGADSGLHDVTALERLMAMIDDACDADIMLFDVGPSLGALNHAVLFACDAIVLPLAPDLLSLRGMKLVGQTVAGWKAESGDAPRRAMRPIGYVIQQHLAREEFPRSGYARWSRRIPDDYEQYVLGLAPRRAPRAVDETPHCLSHQRHFASLVPLARMAGKPLFDLTHADGVLGSQFQLVERARVEFTALAQKILTQLDAK